MKQGEDEETEKDDEEKADLDEDSSCLRRQKVTIQCKHFAEDFISKTS